MTKQPDNSGHVAIVTGASRGIGRATSLELATRGYDICAVSRPGDEGALDVLAGEIRAIGGRRAHLVRFDLGDVEHVESVVDEAVAVLGRVDLLVNNAAWRELLTMREISLESWDRTLRVCLTAPAMLARRCAWHMERAGGGGVIINVSSVMSQRSNGVSPAYVAAKGALEALTRELAVLYGATGIRVAALSPGAVDTEMGNDALTPEQVRESAELRKASERAIPAGRWATPGEVARAIAMLAGRDATYLNGTVVILDGGWGAQLESRDVLRLIKPEQFGP